MNISGSITELSGKARVKKGWNTFIISFFLLFVIFPTVYVLYYGITGWETIQEDVLSDPETVDIILSAISYSFGIATVVTLVDIVVGLPIAWILVRKEFRGKRYLDTLIDMPLAFPTAALGFSAAIFWSIPVDAETPVGALGIITSPAILIILLHIMFSYPYMVRSLAAILEQIDQSYETAGRTLGASKFTAVRTITLPLFRAGLVTGTILCFARSLSETGGTLIALNTIGRGDDFFTGPTLIGTWKGLGGHEPALAFVSILLILFALVLLVIIKQVLMKVHIPFSKVWPMPEKRLSKGFFPKFKDGFSIGFLIFIILIPSFFIFAYVFTTSPTSSDWGAFWDSLGYSFSVASVVTVIDLLLGVPLALYIVKNGSGRLGNILDVLVNVPLIVPTAALGFSLGLFWSDQSLIPSNGTLLVILAHVAFTYPLVVRNVAGSVEEVDPSFEETARTLGARPLQSFRKVLYPMIKSSILAGSIMAFTRSLGETGATLAVNAEAKTAPVFIVNLIKNDQAYYQAAVACIVLIAVSYMAMLLLRYLTKRQGTY